MIDKTIESENDKVERLLDEAIKISESIVNNRKILDSLELITIVTSIIFRTLVKDEDFEKVLNLHIKMIKNAPLVSPIKGTIVKLGNNDVKKSH